MIPNTPCPSLTALLAAGPVSGAGGHWRGQLLHHRSHHHWRPLHQEHAHAHAVCLLLCHPFGQVSTRGWGLGLSDHRIPVTPLLRSGLQGLNMMQGYGL